MNQAFREILSAHAASAIAAAKALKGVQHDGLRGQLREILASKFLTPLLPPSLGIGTGEIISCKGQHSPQQDLIIYDKANVPPALIGDSESGLFPIDAVLYTIEVKSTLTASTLKSTHEAAVKIEAMDYINPNPEKCVFCLFAFNTDLESGKSESQRYVDFLRGISEIKTPIRAICVPSKGYWFWNGDAWEEGYVSMQKFPGAAMLDFASTILAGYERIKATRVKNLNSYLCDN